MIRKNAANRGHEAVLDHTVRLFCAVPAGGDRRRRVHTFVDFFQLFRITFACKAKSWSTAAMTTQRGPNRASGRGGSGECTAG